MTAERDELHRLVDELPDEDVPAALADVKRHRAPAVDGRWPPAWFGAATATTTDAAERAADLLADGFGRSA